MTLEQQVFSFILILTRVAAFVGFLPLFGKNQIPAMVKIGLAMALTIFWFGSLPADAFYTGSINVVTAVLQIGKETAIGFLLAAILGFMFVPAQIAGAYVGQEMGLSLASVASPSGSDSSTLVTTVFETLAILLFFGLNLHHFMIVFLHVSLVELSGKIDIANLPTELLVQSTHALSEVGCLLAGPVGICLFVLTIALALLNKAAPTLNLFSVGMPLRAGLGLVCLFVFMPVIMKSIEMYFLRYQADLETFALYFQ